MIKYLLKKKSSEIRDFHGFEDLVLEMSGLLPQTKRDVHLTHTVPVEPEVLNGTVLENCVGIHINLRGLWATMPN